MNNIMCSAIKGRCMPPQILSLIKLVLLSPAKQVKEKKRKKEIDVLDSTTMKTGYKIFFFGGEINQFPVIYL